jgi:hypothetical protein
MSTIGRGRRREVLASEMNSLVLFFTNDFAVEALELVVGVGEWVVGLVINGGLVLLLGWGACSSFWIGRQNGNSCRRSDRSVLYIRFYCSLDIGFVFALLLVLHFENNPALLTLTANCS